MATRRKKTKDHAQEVYDTHLEDDDEEGLESEEAEGGELPADGDGDEGASGAADEDDAADEDTADSEDEDDEEEVRDPYKKGRAEGEAYMRRKFRKRISQMEAQIAQLTKGAGGTNDTVRTLRLENEFLRLAGPMFEDADAAYKLADTSKATIADDGTVTGMQEAVDAVAEKYPFLVRDDEPIPVDEDDYLNDPDLPSGRPMNPQRKSQGRLGPKANDSTLYRKYPALARRRWGS